MQTKLNLLKKWGEIFIKKWGKMFIKKWGKILTMVLACCKMQDIRR